MKSVFIVTYETCVTFEILEVFKTKELAEKYFESDTAFDMLDNGYVMDSFYIIEKIVWSE